VIKYFINYFI